MPRAAGDDEQAVVEVDEIDADDAVKRLSL